MSVLDRQVENEEEVSCYIEEPHCAVLAAKVGLFVRMQAFSSAPPGKVFEETQHPYPQVIVNNFKFYPVVLQELFPDKGAGQGCPSLLLCRPPGPKSEQEFEEGMGC